MKAAAALHDLSLALIVGGIAGAGFAVSMLFDLAPSHEIAGQVANPTFGRLGPAVALLAVVLFATEMILRRARPASATGTASIILHAVLLALALALAFWLTPRLVDLWHTGAHAADGSGLEGEARRRFMMLHGIGNLIYLAILAGGIGIVVLRALDPARADARST